MLISRIRFASLMVFTALLFFQNTCCDGQEEPLYGKNDASEFDLRSSALDPKQSASEIVLQDSLESVRVLASEPLAVDPVEVAFDDRGRMWVVEMRDYPFQKTDLPRGRVKVLTDLDADGLYDQAAIFADNLDMPTGLALREDGILLTVAGELLCLRDTNSDLQSDETQQWIRGFKVDNEQLRANHPTLGPDGWWYIACGLRGGDVVAGSYYDDSEQFASATRSPIRIGSRDIRFNPGTGEIQTVSGRAQFGLTFDALGSRLFCSNRNPAVQVIFEQSDLNDNPLASLVASSVDVIPAGEASRVFPLLDAWTTSNLHAGQFTAACGLLTRVQTHGSGKSDLLQELYVCEPTASLIRRSVAKRGTAYLELIDDQRPPEEEWLASRDPWFRPVNVNLGLTGEPVVVDMHRAVIEHPNWVPEELKNRPDERWGDDTGRVLLISRDEGNSWQELVRELRENPLRDRSTLELAPLAASDNEWLRITVRRLLLERRDRTATPVLIQLALDGNRPLPSRISAILLANELEGSWSDYDLLLHSDTPTALILALLRSSRNYQIENPIYVPTLLKLAHSADNAVVFESLLCLAKHSPASLDRKLLKTVSKSESPHLLVAASAAMRNHPDRFLNQWLTALSLHGTPKASEYLAEAAEALVASCKRLPGNKNHSVNGGNVNDHNIQGRNINGHSVKLSNGRLQSSVNQSTHILLSNRNADATLAALSVLVAAYRDGNAATIRSDRVENQVLDLVVKIAEDTTFADIIRSRAVELLGYSKRSIDKDRIAEWVKQSSLPSLEKEANTALLSVAPDLARAQLIQKLSGGTPSQIRLAVSLLSQSEKGLRQTANWLAEEPDRAKRLGPTELKSLSDRARGELKSQFESALSGLVNTDRAEVIERYQTFLDQKTNLEHGKRLFSQHCSACHQIDGYGYRVGPDISDSRTQTQSQLLTSILDPNRAIDNNYFRFVVLTDEDQIEEGIVVEETNDAIVLMGQEAKRTTVARNTIVEMRATGVSLMPEGLESQMTPQAMADLIGYIKNWRYESGLPVSPER